jgi:flagellar biosynthesis protein FlhG
MIEALADQAAGLRRLLSPRVARTVAVTGAATSAGHSAVAANLALALTARDRNVVLVDARGGAYGSARMLGVEPVQDLLEVVLDGRPAGEACAPRGAALRVVRAQQMLAAAPRLSQGQARRLVDALADISAAADAVIFDAEPWAAAPLSAADHAVLVTGDDSEAVTAAYRYLKRMAAGFGPRRVFVVMNEVHSPARAHKIFGNLAATAAQFLSLPLECMGQIPHDKRQQQAVSRGRPLIELFPESPAAAASRRCADALLALLAQPGAPPPAFAGRLLEALRAAA